MKPHVTIPWKEIVGMRNRLIHDYTRIDLPTVWDTVQNHISPLLVQLEPGAVSLLRFGAGDFGGRRGQAALSRLLKNAASFLR